MTPDLGRRLVAETLGTRLLVLVVAEPPQGAAGDITGGEPRVAVGEPLQGTAGDIRRDRDG